MLSHGAIAGRWDRLAHHGLALADVTLECESSLLEHGSRAVVEERGRCTFAWGELVGERDHFAAAGLRDELERSIQRLPCYSRTSMVAVHEEAGDAPGCRHSLACVVLLAVVDARQFDRVAVLAPRDRVVAVEDKCGVCDVLRNKSLLKRLPVVIVLDALPVAAS